MRPQQPMTSGNEYRNKPLPNRKTYYRYFLMLFVVGIFLCAGKTSASLTTGPFLSSQTANTTLIQTDGETFFIEGVPHPVPEALKPVAPFSFSRTPSNRVLFAYRSGDETHCPSGTRISFYRIPSAPNSDLELIVNDFCIDNGMAWDRYFDQPFLSSQQIAAIAERRPETAINQRIRWINLETGVGAWSSFEADIEDPGLLFFAPSGTSALVRYDTTDSIGGADYRLVDLCPATLGRGLHDYHNLGGLMTAELVSTSGGYEVIVTHDGLPGGSDSLPVDDCLGPPPPPPPGTLTVAIGGSGTGIVSSSPGSIFCPGDCDETFPDGTPVDLVALPDAGSVFSRWHGDVTGTDPSKTIVVGGFKSCTAEFRRLAADIVVTETAPATIVAGQQMTYSITVRNNGHDSATGVVLTDTLPPGLSFVSGSGCDASGAGNITCPLGSIAAGSSIMVQVTVLVDSTLRGSISNTASASANEFDPLITNNTATATTTITATASISITISIAGSVYPGNIVAARVNVQNAGPSAATGVSVGTSFPPGFVPLSGVVDPICGQGVIRPGETRRLTLLRTVDSATSVGTALVISATVSAIEFDPDLSDNTAAATATVVTAPPPAHALFTKIADTSTAIPDGSGVFDSFSEPAVNGELVVFKASGAGQEGVYTSIRGLLLPTADRNTWIPGSTRRFDGFLPSLPSIDGYSIAFNGYTSGGSGPAQDGVYDTDNCGLHVAVNQDTPLPNSRATDRNHFTSSVKRNGRIAFFASNATHSGIHLWDGSSVAIIADRDTAIPGGTGLFEINTFDDPAYDGATVAFSSTRNVFGDPNFRSGIYYRTAPGNPLLRAVDQNTPVPNGSGNFHGVKTSSIDQGKIAFLGTDTATNRGIYLYDVTTGAITVIADINTPVPGSSGNFHIDPVTPPVVSGGRVAFLDDGVSNSANGGIYLYENGVIRRVAGRGDLIDGQAAQVFFIGPQALSGNRLAFRVSFNTFPPVFPIRFSLYVADITSTIPVPAGTNVSVTSGSVTVTFAQVTTAGELSINSIDPALAGTLPGEFQLRPGYPAYEINTTAVYAAPVTVCIKTPPSTDAEFDRLRILHGESGVLVDRTILPPDAPPPDPVTHTLCGRVTSLSPFVIARLGNRAPEARCQNVTVTAGANCNAAASIDNGSFDPDGDSIVVSESPSGPYSLGSTLVTLTVTDGHGGSSQCTATVTVLDGTPPSINCPANIVTSTTAGQCTAVVHFSATASDNCSGVVVACAPPSGSAFAKGVTTVTCTANDGSNTTSCSFTVTVNDASPPSITCPGNVSVTAPAGSSSTAVSYATPQVSDNCSVANVSCLPPSGSIFPLGATTVACTASDTSGNNAQCSFTVTVSSQTTPPPAPNRIAFETNRDGNLEVYSMNADGTELTRLTFNPAADGNPAWSPDHRKIAFTSLRNGNPEIYVMNADGSNQTRLTNNAAIDDDPAWSPDGSKIAFWSSRNGNAEIYVMNADGSNQTRLTFDGRTDTQPEWSPNGMKIAFTSNRSDLLNFDIYVMNANGSGVTRLTTNRALDDSPAWSPDGSKIAFTSNRGGLLDFEIWVMNADGSSPVQLTSGKNTSVRASWSRDGSKIAFASNRDGLVNFDIFRMNANGSNVIRITASGAIDFAPSW